MSTTVNELSFIFYIKNSSKQINRYVPIFLLLLGIISNLTSCLVFRQRKLRINLSSAYFFSASLSNLIFTTAVLSPLLDAWNESFNLISTISALCKLYMFITLTTRTLALWFIVLAAIDRYLVSCSYIGQHRINQLRNASYWIKIVCGISIIVWIQSFYCFDVNQIVSPIKCYSRSNTCHLYNNISLALFTIIIPSLIMFIFTLLTIVNVHQSQQIIHPSINVMTSVTRRYKKVDRYLTRLLFRQVFLTVVLNLPQALYIFYLKFTSNQFITPVQDTLRSFIFRILLLLPFLYGSLSFLFCTFCDRIFRGTLLRFGNKIIKCIKCSA